MRAARLPVQLARAVRGARGRRAVREPVPRLAGQRHVERVRVLRRRDGHDAGGRGRLLRGLRRQPVEDRRAGEDRGEPGRERAPDRRSSRASRWGTGRGSRTRRSIPSRGCRRTRSRSSSCRAIQRGGDSDPPTDPQRARGVPRRASRRPSSATRRCTARARARRSTSRRTCRSSPTRCSPTAAGSARVTGSTLLLPTNVWDDELRRRRRVPGADDDHRGPRRTDDRRHRAARTGRT